MSEFFDLTMFRKMFPTSVLQRDDNSHCYPDSKLANQNDGKFVFDLVSFTNKKQHHTPLVASEMKELPHAYFISSYCISLLYKYFHQFQLSGDSKIDYSK